MAGTLGTTLAIQGASLISGALLAHLLGVLNRGVLAAIILWPSIVVHAGDLGGPIANAYLAATRPKELSRLAANSLGLAAAQSLLLAGPALLLLSIGLQGAERRSLPAAMAFIACYVPANLLYRYFNFINLGMRNFVAFNAARLTLQLVYVLGLVAGFIIGLRTVEWALAAYAFSHVAAAAVASRPVLVQAYRDLAPSYELLKKSLSYGLRAHLGNLTPIDMMQLDLAVVVLLLPTRDAGLYAVAISAGMVIRQYGAALGMVALPDAAASLAANERKARAAAMIRVSVIVLSLMATAIMASANLLVPIIYGRDFVPAVAIIRILCIGMVAAGLRQVLGDCLRGLGYPMLGTISEVSSWIVAILGLLTFVPRIGTTGAAIAVTASYLFALGMSTFFVLRVGIGWRQLALRTEDLRLLWRMVRSVLLIPPLVHSGMMGRGRQHR